MSTRLLLCFLCAAPAALYAQHPMNADSMHMHGDTLSRPPIRLEEITVTAQRTTQQAPASVTTVTPEQIQRTMATSPWDLLRQTAGVEVHEQGQGPGFASDASIRGFSSDHSTDLALWVDGVPINEPVNGHSEGYGDWSLLFPQSIDDMQVIKGPVSPLFGNFALAGVVNVRTLQRLDHTTGWFDAGAHGRVEGTVLTGFDHPHSGGVFGIRAQRDDGWRPNGGWQLGQAYGRFVRDVTSSLSIDAGANVYLTDWHSPGFLTDEQYEAKQYDFVENPTDRGFKRRAQERISARLLAGDAWLWRTTLYATQGRWQLFLTTPPEGGISEGTGSQTEEEDRRYGFGLTSALTWQLPSTEVTFGTQNRYDHADYQNWLTTARVRDESQILVSARQLSGGLFAQSSTDVTHHVRLDLGARYDVLDTRSAPAGDQVTSASKGVVSPKAGVLVHLRHVASLYANVSRGFRQADGVITDPAIPFITEWAFENGLKLDVRRGNINIALFRMDVSNEQSFNPLTLTTTNGGRSRRQGVDVSGMVHASELLTVTANLTFNDARYRHLVTEDGDTLSGTRVFNTAKYVGSVGLDVTPSKALDLQVATSILGPYTPFDEPGVVLPAYALVNLTAGYDFQRFRVQLGVHNALDKQYPEVRAGGFVSPGQPRSIYGTVRYRM